MSFNQRLPLTRPLALLASLLIHALVVIGVIYMATDQQFAVEPAQQAMRVEMMAAEQHSESSKKNLPRMLQSESLSEQAPAAISQPVITPPSEISIAKHRPVKPHPKTGKKAAKVAKLAVNSGKITKKLIEKSSPQADRRPSMQNKPQAAPTSSDSSAQNTPQSSGLPRQPTSELGPLRTTTVNPAYPARALALQIEGLVKVKFDVDSNGQLVNLQIVMARPRNIFETEVRQALRRWRYQPGKPVKDQQVTIFFRLNAGSSVQ